MMADRIRLRQICLLTAKLEPAIDAVIDVFGVSVCYGKGDLTRYGVPNRPAPPFQAAFFESHGLVSALLPFGDTFLELVAPKRADTPAMRFLERRGPGGYMVITEVDDTGSYAARVEAAGARYAGIVDYPTYHELQIDPRDVRGAMLSFSMQRQGKPFDGGWYPAGADWRARIAGNHGPMRGAELAVGDPEAVAGRWSRLIGRPAVDAGDHLRIDLEDSEIRFVQDTQAGPDRLDVIHVESALFGEAVARARSRGQPVSGEAISMLGVTFKARGAA